ncbi:uncharacterized protein LOC129729417 [Wyeomyia smithii]|uniref:uncharacterized protein LOC129729417 n=1 Tax=Wyeomyia smithii TaxID=174621 RepID=UPI002467F703|nr:uncharacterized protein LOC129729417 [Wyeomyia smithii]XP_055543951.1 uncharacterized protein LOC129729417 [Wyeomyia smithii]XP_055543952.1 uncharacterized protein LOC129729417 [Wyeomyia smithii]
MTSVELSCRQPDYFIKGDGIPRLVGKFEHSLQRKMSVSHNSSIVPATDPIKLKKCLYNITVRNSTLAVVHGFRSSKTESDIAIRSRSGNKSSSSTSGINSSNSSSSNSCSAHATSPPAVSVCLVCSHSSSTSSVLNNWRGSIASQTSSRNYDARLDNRRVRVNSSSIPVEPGRNYNYTCRATRPSTTSSIPTDSSSTSIRLNGVTNQYRSSMLLGDRQRTNADGATSSTVNRNLMRQCRFTARTVTAAPMSDNRLNYQRQYDRSVFGYNRLDQFVLPPLQI